jgi:hypothetical protein
VIYALPGTKLAEIPDEPLLPAPAPPQPDRNVLAFHPGTLRAVSDE